MGIASIIIRIMAQGAEAVRGVLDRVKSSLSNIVGPLAQIRNITAGILLAEVFTAAARAVKSLISEAINATATIQNLRLQIQSLTAREMAATINSTKEMNEEWITASSIFAKAYVPARDLFHELMTIAVLSPYTVALTGDIFRLFMAFQWGTKASMDMTKGMMNLAAGIGATTEMVQRMTFNFAQIRMQGKIMARDFWELGKAGFDLYGVLKELERQTKYTIKTHLDFNKLLAAGKVTWEDFTKAFVTMAERDFGKAAERFAYTITGIKNNLSDLSKLIVPQLLMPTAEAIGMWAEKITKSLLKISKSGVLEEVGEKIGDFVGRVVGFVMNVATLAPKVGIVDALRAALQNFGVMELPEIEKWQGLAQAIEDLAKVSWGILIDGLSGVSDSLSSFFDTLRGGAGDTETITKITDTLERLTAFIDEHSDELSQGITTIVTSLAILTGIKIGTTLIALGVAIAGISVPLAILAGVLLLGVGAWAMWETNIGGVRDKILELAAVVNDKFTTIKDNITTALEGINLEEFGTSLSRLKDTISRTAIEIGVKLAPFTENFKKFLDWLSPISYQLKELWDSIKIAAEPVLIIVGNILLWLADVLVGTLGPVVGGIIDAISRAFLYLGPIISGVISIISGIVTFIGGIFQLILGFFTGNTEKMQEAHERMKEGIGKIWEGIKRTIANVVLGIIDVAWQLIKGIAEGIVGFIDRVWETLKTAWEKMKTNLGIAWNAFVEVFKSGISSFLETLLSPLVSGKLWEIGRKIIQSIRDGIENAWEKLKTWFGELIAKLPEWVKNLLGIKSPSKIFEDIGANIVGGLQQGLSTIDDVFAATKRSITTGVSNLSKAAAMSGLSTMPQYAPALAGMGGGAIPTQEVVHHHYDLTIVTQARKEDVQADYELMKTWARG